MKKLGLVGGLGPQSTLIYYRDIMNGVYAETGLFPPLTLESVEMYALLELCEKKDYAALTAMLAKAVNSLAASGALTAAICANTPHIVFSKLCEHSPIPLVSIVDVAVAEAKARGYSRLLLLGTEFTMESDLYKKPFAESGMEMLVPNGDDARYISEKISLELEHGIIEEQTRSGLVRIIEKSNADAVILGCTELPLILSDDCSPLSCLDTMRLHINALIDEVLRG